jgi:hypothetical protein
MGATAPDSVKRLVDHFDQNRDAYLSGSCKEEQLRDQKLAITDHQIDALVYELYGLTQEQISVVEGG